MNRQILCVTEIEALQPGIFSMTLAGDCSCITAPGQFLHIALDGLYLRRPISIRRWDASSVNIVFKVVGQGTAQMAQARVGDTYDVLLPLGNGFDVDRCGRRPLLVGGGIGVPPLYGLAQALLAEGCRPQLVTGFNTRQEIILAEDFHRLGVDPVITTADGSVGVRGFVTDAMAEMDYDYVFACGPEPMLQAVYHAAPDGQFSFEARMACGFGACMGCTCETKYGYKRICKDGPVLYKEEIKW